MIRVWNSGTSDVAARKLRLGWLQSFVGEKLTDHADFCSVGVVSFLAGKVCVLVQLKRRAGDAQGSSAGFVQGCKKLFVTGCCFEILGGLLSVTRIFVSGSTITGRSETASTGDR